MCPFSIAVGSVGELYLVSRPPALGAAGSAKREVSSGHLDARSEMASVMKNVAGDAQQWPLLSLGAVKPLCARRCRFSVQSFGESSPPHGVLINFEATSPAELRRWLNGLRTLMLDQAGGSSGYDESPFRAPPC